MCHRWSGPESPWVELASGGDAEFGESLVEVIAHRSRAEEELGGNVAVGQPLGGEPRDLQLLRRQPGRTGPVCTWCRSVGGGELGPGLFRPRYGVDPVQGVHGGA